MVSVLTTVYNRAKFLGECIESVQRSRFTDYEHIIVDDGSTDDSVAIARRYASEDSRIRVFVNEQNLGDYPNRNKAATHASGKYLKYLDADDLHGPWILNVMVDAMEQFPNAGFGIIDHGKNVPTFATYLTGAEAQDDYYSKRRNIFDRSPINTIIKKDAFLASGEFSGKRMVGDFEMWHRLTRNHDLVVIPNGHGHYREHEEQEMTHHRQDPIWGFRYFIVSRNELSHPENPMPEATRINHLRNLDRRIGRTILNNMARFGLSKANQMRHEVGWTWRQVVKCTFQ